MAKLTPIPPSYPQSIVNHAIWVRKTRTILSEAMDRESESLQAFKVCSFNIRNGDAEDGQNSWPYRADTVVELLKQIDADLFGLQEVMDYQLTSILEGLPDHGVIGVGRLDGESKGEYAPILYRKSKFLPVRSGWFWLSETPSVPGSMSWDTACERICTWADFGAFQFYNTHLDHVSALAQLRGAQLILGRMEDSPTLLTGDLNVVPTDPVIEFIRSVGFADAIAPVSQSTFHNWRTEELGQIDYIFSRGLVAQSPAILTAQLHGRDASDHFAVTANFSCKR